MFVANFDAVEPESLAEIAANAIANDFPGKGLPWCPAARLPDAALVIFTSVTPSGKPWTSARIHKPGTIVIGREGDTNYAYIVRAGTILVMDVHDGASAITVITY